LNDALEPVSDAVTPPTDEAQAPATAAQPLPQRVASLRLRFRDRALEEAFREDRFELNRGNVRFAFLAGIALWVSWGVLLRPYMLSLDDQALDLKIRLGVFIPLLIAGLALSYAPIFARVWEEVSAAIAIITIVVWVFYSSNIYTLPAEYSYVGVILITAFTYTLLRLRFVLVVLVTVIGIAAYLPYAFTALYIVDVSRVLATLYLVSFGGLGCLAAYWIERFTRQLFLRQRELDRERSRSDALLLNILPKAVIEQLKTSSGERIADAFEDVSVVFIDAVGSTQQAARTSPEEFADALDRLFRCFDEIADRHGLEKIKTVGDAYLAVAGAPVPMSKPADAAMAMAVEILGQPLGRWPTGDPITVHGGVASGPAVAGVIGERKFAYDVWGDTVNLASRLQEQATPGRVLVSDRTASAVGERYAFGPVEIVDIKGKGPTQVRALLAPDHSVDRPEQAPELEPS
jgi:class 3 adenylate cyclase